MRAVVLAGGEGRRLMPYTAVLPKPLMPLGETPILEVVLRQLEAAGFESITLACGHLAGLIASWLDHRPGGDTPIELSVEARPLGTVGPLGRLPRPDGPFLVMNGDVLTDLDYRALMEEHRRHAPAVTIAMTERRVPVEFGVLHHRDGRLERYTEKPVLTYEVSTGVYVFSPEALAAIDPTDERLDFPDLIGRLLAAGRSVRVWRWDGYWRDIGRPEDHAEAAERFAGEPERFLPRRLIPA